MQQWRSALWPPKSERKLQISTSLPVHLQCAVWMWSGQLTGSALTAAVRLMGPSCPPGHCWGLCCACLSAGQLQRGKFKNGFWRIKCNTVKYSTGATGTGSHSLQYHQNRWFFYYCYFSCWASLSWLLFFNENIDVLMFFRLYHNCSVQAMAFKPELMWLM